ncbi:protease propeptide/inhibitor [Mycena pura]|uniref:Protease propeptide/inhibitor n=1 Tax=Mycena pura TaxID=153505 RepID=A0AAD6V568_9AGAR|nr:protease propeptide/inhibitor [Mycena pura]
MSASKPPPALPPSANKAPEYIVVFKDGIPQDKIDEFMATFKDEGKSKLLDENQRFTIPQGFSATLTDATFAKFNSLQADPNSPIDFIEQDSTVTTQ